ncbi:MAG: hypothetical protein ACE5F1_09750 [Planctomycetota bacterium]
MISPISPRSLQAASAQELSPQQDSGVLVLGNGERVVGEIRPTKDGYRVRQAGKLRTIPRDEVQRWLKRPDLEARLADLARLPNAQTSFALAQRSAWAFDNGLEDLAWPMLMDLYLVRAERGAIRAAEQAASQVLLRSAGAQRNPTQLARSILLRVRKAKPETLAAARNRVAAYTIAELLARESEQADGGKRPLEALVRGYAEDSVGSSRRKVARQALLRADPDGKRFVYRLAVRFPKGPTRSSILDDIQSEQRQDDAADYLGLALLQARSLGRMLRTTEILGDLRSPKALPALYRMKSKVPELRAKLRRGSAGSGATRANISVVTQTSYIRDFDVEIAQAAAIADPVVDVIQSGVVLDVTVAGISWTRYITYLDSSLDRAIDKIQKDRLNKGAGTPAARTKN